MHCGFTKAWRKELKSDIWQMPPIYHRVWYWLRQKVQYEPFLFPTNKGFGIWVLPGQRVISYQQIAEGVAWSEWGKEKIPNKKTIKDVIEWLEKEKMVSVESNALGTVITIINWDVYNHSTPVESNAEETIHGQPSGIPTGNKEERKRINKNEKEGEELKNEVKRFIPPTLQEIIDYCLERKNNIDPEAFFHHYQTRNWIPKGYTTQMKSWKSAIITWEKKQGNQQEPLFNDKPKSFRERVNDAAVDGFLKGEY